MGTGSGGQGGGRRRGRAPGAARRGIWVLALGTALLAAARGSPGGEPGIGKPTGERFSEEEILRDFLRFEARYVKRQGGETVPAGAWEALARRFDRYRGASIPTERDETGPLLLRALLIRGECLLLAALEHHRRDPQGAGFFDAYQAGLEGLEEVIRFARPQTDYGKRYSLRCRAKPLNPDEVIVDPRAGHETIGSGFDPAGGLLDTEADILPNRRVTYEVTRYHGLDTFRDHAGIPSVAGKPLGARVYVTDFTPRSRIIDLHLDPKLLRKWRKEAREKNERIVTELWSPLEKEAPIAWNVLNGPRAVFQVLDRYTWSEAFRSKRETGLWIRNYHRYPDAADTPAEIATHYDVRIRVGKRILHSIPVDFVKCGDREPSGALSSWRRGYVLLTQRPEGREPVGTLPFRRCGVGLTFRREDPDGGGKRSENHGCDSVGAFRDHTFTGSWKSRQGTVETVASVTATVDWENERVVAFRATRTDTDRRREEGSWKVVSRTVLTLEGKDLPLDPDSPMLRGGLAERVVRNPEKYGRLAAKWMPIIYRIRGPEAARHVSFSMVYVNRETGETSTETEVPAGKDTEVTVLFLLR